MLEEKDGRLFDAFEAVQYPEEGNRGEGKSCNIRQDCVAQKCEDKLPNIQVTSYGVQ